MSTFNIELDVSKQEIVPKAVRARVGDAEGCEIVAVITRDGDPYDLTGLDVRFECILPDGTKFRDGGTSVSGSKATYTLPSEVVMARGLVKVAYFRITSGIGVVDSTESFIIDVKPGIRPCELGVPERCVPELDEALAALKQQTSESASTNREIGEAEADRAAAEKARESAEASRKSAEKERASAESARKSAETARASAEEGRASAESRRESAESTRKSSETARQSAESTRASQESARVSAESARASEFGTLKSQSQAATNAANGAATNANNAATYARSVADNLQSSVVGDEYVAEMRDQIDKLGSMLADSTGDFFYMDGTIYAPSAKASISGSTVTLGSTCTASGNTITLA